MRRQLLAPQKPLGPARSLPAWKGRGFWWARVREVDEWVRFYWRVTKGFPEGLEREF